MSDCCRSANEAPKRYRCPVNGKEYASVSIKTILHHLVEPWERDLGATHYYFCSDKDCDVVYFGQDNSVISRSELRSAVGVKQSNPERMLCYCFGVSYAAATENSRLMNFVREQTAQALCACETRNPSGRCCLKDFPKQ